jgi:hypothetical protein
MQAGNNKIGLVLKEVNNLSNTENTEVRTATNKAINKLIKKLKNHIKGLDIEVKLVQKAGNFKANEKAKITTTTDGKTAILINEELGQTEDVLHEFLHLFLIPLRYKYPEIYNSLISSIVTDPNLNITEAEEQFVKFIASKMESKEDFIDDFDSLQNFVNGIKTILTNAGDNFEISNEENPVTLLNTPLMDLFNIDRNENTHALYNLGMITTEPLMRE